MRTSETQPPPYDVWLNWMVTDKCNLNCPFCFANLPADERHASARQSRVPGFLRPLKSRLYRLLHPARDTSRIDVDALLATLERMGRTCRINLTGGEPFLVPNFVEAALALSQHHYLAVTTNLTCRNVRDFATAVDPVRVRHVLASCHVNELDRLGLFDRYVEHYRLFADRGITICAQEVAYPPLAGQAAASRQRLAAEGITLEFTPFYGSYREQVYPAAYTAAELNAFGLTARRDQPALASHRGLLCNAGYNAAAVMPNGQVTCCYQVTQSLGNIYERVKWRPRLLRCPVENCSCPFYAYDRHLFEKACAETGQHDPT